MVVWLLDKVVVLLFHPSNSRAKDRLILTSSMVSVIKKQLLHPSLEQSVIKRVFSNPPKKWLHP